MSLGHNPKIVKDSLCFYFDLQNSNKSFKGKPTSNIISSQGITGMSITYTYVGIEDGWKKYSISGTWSSGTYPYSFRLNNTTLTGGVAYSARCLMKTNVQEKFATFGGINYVNDPNMVNAGALTANNLGPDFDGLDIIESKREGFIYSTGYANPTTNQPGYLLSRPLADGTSFNPSTDFVWMKEIQVEEGSFCTRYVDGVRLDTASIIDLSKNGHSVNAANITYQQNNVPTFDGANDYVDLPNDIGYTNQVSPFAWFRSLGSPPGTYHIIMGGQELEISIRSTGYLRVGVLQGSRYVSDHGSGLTDGNWHYVGFTFNGTTKTAYIDGEPVGTQSVPAGTLTNSFANRRIGRFGSSTSYYVNGDISQVKIYNKALTSAEVKQNYNALKGRYGL